MQELGLEEDVNTTSDRAMDTLWQHMQTTTIQQRQGKSGIRPNVVEGVVFGGGSKRKNKTRKHKNKKSKRNYRQIGNTTFEQLPDPQLFHILLATIYYYGSVNCFLRSAAEIVFWISCSGFLVLTTT